MANGKRELVPVPDVSPPRAIDKQTALQTAERKVRGALRKNIMRLQELAAGVILVDTARAGDPWRQIVLRNIETGEERVIGDGLRIYVTPPNREALTYLIDRGMGKPPQRHEVTGDDGGPLTIVPWMPAEATYGAKDEAVT